MGNTSVYKSYAKINMFLSVNERLSNGYHKVDTIIQKISLYDELCFEIGSNYFKCTDSSLETDDNLILRAKRLIEKEVGRDLEVGIKLIKNIPHGAGLGGGSSNAAVTMVALNELFNLGLKVDKLRSLASKIGMDVPFFINGNLALCTGMGEIVEVREPLKLDNILLFRKGGILPTGDVYGALKKEDFSAKDIYTAYEKIKDGDYSYMINDLEKGAFRVDSKIRDLKNIVDADKVMLSGSGNVFFAIYSSKEKLDSDYKILQDKVDKVIKVHTIWR